VFDEDGLTADKPDSHHSGKRHQGWHERPHANAHSKPRRLSPKLLSRSSSLENIPSAQPDSDTGDAQNETHIRALRIPAWFAARQGLYLQVGRHCRWKAGRL